MPACIGYLPGYFVSGHRKSMVAGIGCLCHGMRFIFFAHCFKVFFILLPCLHRDESARPDYRSITCTAQLPRFIIFNACYPFV